MNKNKKILKKWGLIVGVLTMIAMGIFLYHTYEQCQRKEEKRRQDGVTKRWVMMIMGEEILAHDYRKHKEEKSADEKYYKLFLEQKELPVYLEYLKKAMEDEFPEMDYGGKYEEITMERLEKEPLAVGEELYLLAQELEKRGEHIEHVISATLGLMLNDSREFIMSILGNGMGEKYEKSISIYEDYEEFLKEAELKMRLKRLKEYMDEKYPDIGYGDKIEEITLETLDMSPTESKLELEKLMKELDKRGVDITDILKAL